MEVERKYFALCAPAELTARLGALGARVVSVDEFEDEYFDRPTPSLIVANTWLRRRAGAWELKLPQPAARGAAAVFREVAGAAAILRELGRAADMSTELDGLEDALGVAPFARFATRRTRLALGDCSVDVDEVRYADEPMCFVEIERMCGGAADAVDAAHESIDAAAAPLLAAALLTPAANTCGKVEEYIRRFCPAHHAALTRAGLSTATGAESCGAACVRRTAASAAAAVPLVRAGLPITVTG